MENYTNTVQVLNNTFNDTTPKLPETSLYQEFSEDFRIFFYVSMILIGTLMILYLCYCFFSNHLNTIVMMDYHYLRDFK